MRFFPRCGELLAGGRAGVGVGGGGGEISTPEGGTAELTGLRGDRAGFNTNIIPGHGLGGHAALKTSARVPDTIKSSPPQSCRPRTRESVRVGECGECYRAPGLGTGRWAGRGSPGRGARGGTININNNKYFALVPPTFETVAFTASCVSLIETIVCLGDCWL